MCANYRVVVGAWGDVDFDLGVEGGEGGKGVEEELAGDRERERRVSQKGSGLRGGGYVLHALGATGPVTVVEVEAFALEDECAEAIL